MTNPVINLVEEIGNLIHQQCEGNVPDDIGSQVANLILARFHFHLSSGGRSPDEKAFTRNDVNMMVSICLATRVLNENLAPFVVTSSDMRQYRKWGASGPEWTTKEDEALQFARRSDTETFTENDDNAWFIRALGHREVGVGDMERCTSVVLNSYQIKSLLDFVGGEEECEVSIGKFPISLDKESGETMPAGLWAWCTDYPEEGRLYLAGKPDNAAPQCKVTPVPTNVVLDNGKYTFYKDENGVVRCDRYGEEWREFLGDHAVTALFDKVIELRSQENAVVKAFTPPSIHE